jgi:hypothetical protein
MMLLRDIHNVHVHYSARPIHHFSIELANGHMMDMLRFVVNIPKVLFYLSTLA